MATYWLTRSLRASEPVDDVSPTRLPVRTPPRSARSRSCRSSAACLPCSRSCAAYRVGNSVLRGVQPVSAGRRPCVGQIVVPSLGGPLLEVKLGRWVRFPQGAAFVLLLVIFSWVNLATVPSLSHPD